MISERGIVHIRATARGRTWVWLAAAASFVAPMWSCRTPETNSSATTSTRAADAPRTDARTILSNGGSFEVQFTPEPDPIPMNELFSLSVQVKPLAGEAIAREQALTLSADAGMPAHGHGMNTRPKVTPLGGGLYRVDGMLFHMPGHWQLYFDVGTGPVIERAQADINLE